MTDAAEDRLLILARGASRRLDEANAALHEAEVQNRIAWQNYDAYVDGRRTPADTGANDVG